MAAAVAALPVALPLAEKGIQASVNLATTFMGQVMDALRTPLLGAESVVLKETKKGSVRTTYKANLPAWAAIVGAGVTYAILREEGKTAAPPITPPGDGAVTPVDFWLAPISWLWGGWPWNVSRP